MKQLRGEKAKAKREMSKKRRRGRLVVEIRAGPGLDLKNRSNSRVGFVCVSELLLLSPKPSSRTCGPNEMFISDIDLIQSFEPRIPHMHQ